MLGVPPKGDGGMPRPAGGQSTQEGGGVCSGSRFSSQSYPPPTRSKPPPLDGAPGTRPCPPRIETSHPLTRIFTSQRERSKRLFQNLPEVAERRKKETEAKERLDRMSAARETDKKRREAMKKARLNMEARRGSEGR